MRPSACLAGDNTSAFRNIIASVMRRHDCVSGGRGTARVRPSPQAPVPCLSHCLVEGAAYDEAIHLGNPSPRHHASVDQECLSRDETPRIGNE